MNRPQCCRGEVAGTGHPTALTTVVLGEPEPLDCEPRSCFSGVPPHSGGTRWLKLGLSCPQASFALIIAQQARLWLTGSPEVRSSSDVPRAWGISFPSPAGGTWSSSRRRTSQHREARRDGPRAGLNSWTCPPGASVTPESQTSLSCPGSGSWAFPVLSLWQAAVCPHVCGQSPISGAAAGPAPSSLTI